MGAEKYDEESPIAQALRFMGALPEKAAPVTPAPVTPAGPPPGQIPAGGQDSGLLPAGPMPDSTLGKVGYGVDAVLGLPARALWKLPGDALQGVGLTEAGGKQGFMDLMAKAAVNPEPGSLNEALARSGPGVAALPYHINKVFGEGAGRFAMDMIFDPLSFVGGPAGKIGQGVAKGAAAGSKAEKIGKGIQASDELVSKVMAGLANKVVEAGQAGLAPVNKGLGRMMPSLPAWTEYAKRSNQAADVVQFWESKGIDVQSAQAMYMNSPQSLFDILPMTMRSDFGPEELNTLIFATDKATDWATALTKYGSDTRNILGIGHKNAAENFYNQVEQWWKRQALASLSYPITNVLGGMVGFAAEGGNPLLIGQDLVKNANAIWHGKSFHVDAAEKLSKSTGMPIPQSLTREAASATASQLGTNAGQSVQRDALILGVLGALGAGPAGALVGGTVGAVSGAAMAKAAAKVQIVSQGIETVLRERGWQHGMAKELVEAAEEMEGVVRAALSNPRNPAAGRKSGGTIPAPVFADNIAAVLHAAGGQISAEDIINHMKATSPLGKKGGGGLRADVLNVAEETLDDILYNASKRGVDASEAFNFNYDDLSNVERLIHNIAPFSTWLMKAMPYYAVRSAENPWTLSMLHNWNIESEREKRQRGLTNRVTGALPWESGSALASALLGRPTEVWINPLASLIPAGNWQQGIERMEYAQSPSAQVMGALEAVGLGPNPIIGAGLRIAGIGDQDEPAQGIPIRIAGVTKALTGVDVGAAGRQLEQGVRESIPGRPEVTDIGEVSAARRVDELALRDTGKPIGQPGTEAYTRAKLDQSGPIWDKAKKEVGQEQGLQATVGYVNNQLRPQALVGAEESQIRQAQADRVLSREFGTKLQALRANPDAVAPLELQREMLAGLQKISAATGEPIPDVALAVLDDPTVGNMAHLSNEIFKWETSNNPAIAGYRGSGTPEKRELQYAMDVYLNAPILTSERAAAQRSAAPGSNKVRTATLAERDAKQRIVDRHPILGDYLNWKKQHPTGNIDDFIAQRKP